MVGHLQTTARDHTLSLLAAGVPSVSNPPIHVFNHFADIGSVNRSFFPREIRSWVGLNPLRSLRHILLKTFIVLPFICCASVRIPLAQSSGRPLRVFTTARSAHQLTTEEAAKGYPVNLKAVVTYFDRLIDPRRPTLFVSDASGGIFVELSTMPDFSVNAGDLVAITGFTATGDYAPIVNRAVVHPIGTSHLPAKATRVNMMTLLTGAEDGQWVETRGVVHAIRYSSSGANAFLDLALQDGKLIATTVRDPTLDYAALVDATILLRGNSSPRFNHWGQMTGSDIVFPNVGSIKIEQPAALRPFDSPVERVGNLLRYKPAGGLLHRAHVRGEVTLYWPGRMVCIHDETNSLCGETSETDVLAIGEAVDVIGFPIMGEFGPFLSRTYFRRLGKSVKPEARELSPEEIFKEQPENQLVNVQGRLIGLSEAAEDPTMVLAVGNMTFGAALPKNIAIRSLDKLQNGSILSLTGICVLQSDGTGRTTGSGFPIANGFHVLLRSPRDVKIVSRPSWWNAEHTLRMLAAALLLMFGIVVRMVILGTRVKRQTLTILESEKQFRFLASHDSLTQLPNRHAILTIISSSLESAQRTNASTCIAIVDLDHFKKINDTYGHLAGDEVLRQAATRLASSIRQTDSVGRYGGEEFLIVFQGANERIGLERCEFIRRAICCEPINYGTNKFSVSCSIGVATFGSGCINNAATLIGLADDALYKAKANGRNRVEPYLMRTG